MTPDPITEASTKARRRRGEERLKVLIAATDALLNEMELRDVGLSQIAERAGVPLSSVYHFFPSREAAFALTAQVHFDAFEALWAEEMPFKPATWQELITYKIRKSVDYSNNHPSSMRLIFGPHFSDAIRRGNVANLTALGVVRAAQLTRHFHLPAIPELHERLSASIACLDGIMQVSFSKNGSVTDWYATEAIRATLAYMRTFMPEHLEPV